MEVLTMKEQFTTVDEYMHSRLGELVDAYTSARQALDDVGEELHNNLFDPEHNVKSIEEIDLLSKKTDSALLELQHAAMNLSDFVVEYGQYL